MNTKILTRILQFITIALVYERLIALDDKLSSALVVAKAGNTFISEKEFVTRFELLPGFKRHQRSNLEYNKAEFLYTLIAEKLLAQEAIAAGMDRDTIFQQALLTIRKKLARDELYRIEISQKVSLTDVDIIRGIARAPQLLFTSYLYFQKEEDAQFVRKIIKQSSDFESLKLDSSIAFVRDTATVIWGDADPVLENTVYKLKKGQVSPVINTGGGYYITKLLAVTQNKHFSGMQSNALKDHVIEIIRLRKERERLDEYTNTVFSDKKGYSVPKIFRFLTRAFQDEVQDTANKYNSLFSPEMLHAVRLRCKSVLNDSLAVAGNVSWTMNEVIGKLSNKFVNQEGMETANIPAVLNTQIQILVQQELLEQEALRRGLDQRPNVKEKIEVWRDALLAALMKEHIGSSVIVSDKEIYSYLKNTGDPKIIPQVQVRQLKTMTLDEMNSALEEVYNGMKLEEAIKIWSIDTLTKLQNGLTGYFPITEHPPVGEIAWQLDVGQTYGPIAYEGGYLFFELVNKKEFTAVNDTNFVSRYKNARTNLHNMKAKQAMNRFLVQAAQDRGIAVYEDRLKQIKVTSLPMMTFRILGFGGRMLEVPFVDRQLDWLNVEPPQKAILP